MKYLCKVCGKKAVVPVVYGEPTLETWILGERKELIIGGCLIGGDRPREKCLNCGEEYGTGVIFDEKNPL